MRIRIQPFTLMQIRIRIQPFTLMQIRIRILPIDLMRIHPIPQHWLTSYKKFTKLIEIYDLCICRAGPLFGRMRRNSSKDIEEAMAGGLNKASVTLGVA
jgi:hypothetical protein